MAVVRITSQTRYRARAKATIRYIMHRREQGEKITRELFGWEEEGKKKIEAYELIDRIAGGTLFLNMTISPDPKGEDTLRDLDLKEMTRTTMLTLQSQFKNRDIYFFTSVHEGHSDKRHVNMLVLVPARLNREQLALLRQSATDNAGEQRHRLDQDDHSISSQTAPAQAVQAHTRRSYQTSSRPEPKQVLTLADVGKWDPLCPVCLSPMERAGRFLKCENCEILVRRSKPAKSRR